MLRVLLGSQPFWHEFPDKSVVTWRFFFIRTEKLLRLQNYKIWRVALFRRSVANSNHLVENIKYLLLLWLAEMLFYSYINDAHKTWLRLSQGLYRPYFSLFISINLLVSFISLIFNKRLLPSLGSEPWVSPMQITFKAVP